MEVIFSGKGFSAKVRHRGEELSGVALRCMLLMEVIDESYRGTSQRLAQCHLFRWFCCLDHLGVVKVSSKSTLQRFQKWTGVETVKGLNIDLIKAAAKIS